MEDLKEDYEVLIVVHDLLTRGCVCGAVRKIVREKTRSHFGLEPKRGYENSQVERRVQACMLYALQNVLIEGIKLPRIQILGLSQGWRIFPG